MMNTINIKHHLGKEIFLYKQELILNPFDKSEILRDLEIYDDIYVYNAEHNELNKLFEKHRPFYMSLLVYVRYEKDNFTRNEDIINKLNQIEEVILKQENKHIEYHKNLPYIQLNRPFDELEYNDTNYDYEEGFWKRKYYKYNGEYYLSLTEIII